MAATSETTWLHDPFPDELEPGNRLVFGIIREAKVGEPGSTAFFIIDCSDSTVIEEEFVYPTLNPCDAVGSWVKLELSPDNHVGARHFKLIDELRAANHALITANVARIKRREREEVERQTLLRPLLKEVKDRRRAARSGGMRNGILAEIYDMETQWDLQLLEKMSLTALKNLHATRSKGEPWYPFPKGQQVTFRCEKGTIKLLILIDETGDRPGRNDFSALHLITTKVEIKIIPAVGKGRKIAVTLPGPEAVKLFGGDVLPSAENYDSIYEAVCAMKGRKPPVG